MMHLAHVSGGLTSDEASRRMVAQVGLEHSRHVFADTLTEDQDAYRFLIESVADVRGCLTPEVRVLAATCLDLPEATEATMPALKSQLSEIRLRAMRLIPGLVWLCDGRWVWEVFRDERYVGNSRTCPAAKLLKYRQLDGYRKATYAEGQATVWQGLDWTEPRRVERARARCAPWPTEFPLLEAPYVWKPDLIEASRARGIEPPRLYALGFAHNNCGGRCCKKGQGAAALLLRAFPGRYAEDEAQEDRLSAEVGGHRMLQETRAGVKYYLPLRVLRQRIQCGGAVDLMDLGVCGCDVDDDTPAEGAA